MCVMLYVMYVMYVYNVMYVMLCMQSYVCNRYVLYVM